MPYIATNPKTVFLMIMLIFSRQRVKITTLFSLNSMHSNLIQIRGYFEEMECELLSNNNIPQNSDHC